MNYNLSLEADLNVYLFYGINIDLCFSLEAQMMIAL